MTTWKTDIEIAREAKLIPIREIARKLDLSDADLIPYGDSVAKVKMTTVRRRLDNPVRPGQLILVTALTPTPAGEGKTTCSIGLAQGLNHIGKGVCLALREPSLGPCLGLKGGAAGGGQSQVLPMEEINLHFTGDLHAVSAAHNLIAAAADNALHFDKVPGLSARGLSWKRVMDMNDRALRDIVVGLGGRVNGVPRQSGFDITAASEVMAILCLSLSYSDLKDKLARILIGFTESGEPVRAGQLGVQGAAAALLKHALMPNLVQTIEGVPAFVHGGPFANIAQGTNTILATRLALASADYVVTEAGFGCDLGAEKYFNIVSRYAGFSPATVMVVATVRALKMHGGVAKTDLKESNPEAVLAGRGNLEKHLESVAAFGLKPVVAINRFIYDSDAELDAVAAICRAADVPFAVLNSWAEGGAGGAELAQTVVGHLESSTDKARPLYELDLPVEEKIRTVAQKIYGARDVIFQKKALNDLQLIRKHGYENLPVCMAKTQNSLSDDPALLGRPRDFTITVREIIISAGAGFLVPLTGEMMRMPGLPRVPAAEQIDIDENGEIGGLF